MSRLPGNPQGEAGMGESDVTARQKFECPSCGSDAHWNPSQSALVCPYCGTTSPAKLDPQTGSVEENDLVAALRGLPPERRGWDAVRLSVLCQSCKAVSVLAKERVAQKCEFCGSAQIVPQDQIRAPIRPESVLPFKIAESRVRESVKVWFGTRWFAPNRLKKAAVTDTIKGVYLPYWTFDALAHADWTAEAGYYYYETETFRDSNGQSQTRRVRKTRWQWASGAVEHFFDDALVAASKAADPGLLSKIEPFPTKELVPYDAGYLAGWVVEQYQIDLIAAAQHSRERMVDEMESKCASAVPGDTQRNLRVKVAFSRQTFKHTLLPVWLLTYNYGGKSYQVLVNGDSGAIAGKRPWSYAKVFFLVLAIVASGLLIALAARS